MKNIPKWAKIAIPVIVVLAIVTAILFMTGVFGKKTTVPDIEGLLLEEAAKKLEENGLTIFVEKVVPDDSVEDGTVLSQTPQADEKIKEGEMVSVTVSEKAYIVEIPDVTDFDGDLAEEKIEASGANVKVEEQYSDTVPAGTVISQSTKGEGMSSDTVTIIVSKGPEKVEKTEAEKEDETVTVPDIVGKTKDEAKKILSEKGLMLTVSSEEYSNTVEKGKVISQTPKNGEAAKDKTVKVVLSKGKQADNKVLVPNVQYRTLSEAKALLEQRELKVKVTEKSSSTVPKGVVISQSVKAGEKVTAGTTVEIVVSEGAQEQEKTTAPKTTSSGESNKTTRPGSLADLTTRPTTTKPTTTKKPVVTTTKPKTTRPTTTRPDTSAEKKYVADFKITTDKTTASAGDIVTVKVALKTNYKIFTVMLPIVYDGNVFEVINTDDTDVAKYLTFEGQLAKTYKTNGNWKSPEQMYKRNCNPSYWTKADVMNRWKIAYASWAGNPSQNVNPVQLTNEETIVTFQLRVKSDVKSTEGRIFISPDFQKTSDCVGGILAVGRCKDDKFSMNFVDRVQTIKVDRADVKVKIK